MLDILSAWEQWILQKPKEERDAADVKSWTEQEIETRAQEERAELEKKKAEMADKAPPPAGSGMEPRPANAFWHILRATEPQFIVVVSSVTDWQFAISTDKLPVDT